MIMIMTLEHYTICIYLELTESSFLVILGGVF